LVFQVFSLLRIFGLKCWENVNWRDHFWEMH